MADNPQYQDDKGELDVPEQPLPQDYDTPASPPPEEDDEDAKYPVDHPAFDTNLDDHEVYEEGRTGAAEIEAQHVDDDETQQPSKVA